MWRATLSGIFLAYLALVRVLRYRRRDKILTDFAPHELDQMTPATAQKIIFTTLLYDNPMIMLLGTQIALFKVYGISTVASLLLKTGQLKSHESISKRLADTSTLIATWITNPLTGPGSGIELVQEDARGAIAVARVNYLHRKYSISNDDMRYNLALFMIEPTRWTAHFDWRPHSAIERKAIFVFWVEIGRRMGIQDLWATFEEMYEWAQSYEQENMVPSDASAELSRTLLSHYYDRLPRIPGARRLLHNVVLSLIDHRTRTAMMLDEPSRTVRILIHGIFHLRAFIVRHLCLPRRKPAHWVQTEVAWPDGRMHAVYQRRAGPWYYPEPTGIARFKQNVKVALGLLRRENVPGQRWKSEGYRLEELGPVRFESEGHREVMEAAEKIHGRPIKAPWSLQLKEE